MGDVYMLNGKILSGLPNHAKDIEFDNTGTTLSSTNTEDAIKEVNSNLTDNYTITAENSNPSIKAQFKALIEDSNFPIDRIVPLVVVITGFDTVRGFVCKYSNTHAQYIGQATSNTYFYRYASGTVDLYYITPTQIN